MLIDVQVRLRLLAQNHSSDVGYHSYECLIGVAGAVDWAMSGLVERPVSCRAFRGRDMSGLRLLKNGRGD